MKKTILSAVAVGGLAILSQAASAADDKVAYNGSYCSEYYGSNSASFNHQYNGIHNNSASTLYVSCPVIVDEVNNVTGTNSVWIYYTGANTLSCTLRSMNFNGAIRQSMSANRVGTGWLQIPNITTDDIWGSYSMYCSVPSAGTVNTIVISEKP